MKLNEPKLEKPNNLGELGDKSNFSVSRVFKSLYSDFLLIFLSNILESTTFFNT